ncbi:hypothetical protein TNCV_4418591 [Trichonephila clavipes]|nr:hypothetical protein TNCV_4418591 [Trichonephila clavipes]
MILRTPILLEIVICDSFPEVAGRTRIQRRNCRHADSGLSLSPGRSSSSPSSVSLFRPEADETLQHPEYSISRTYSAEKCSVFTLQKDSFQGIKFREFPRSHTFPIPPHPHPLIGCSEKEVAVSL